MSRGRVILPKADIDEAVRLREQRMPLDAIARTLRRSKPDVHAALKGIGMAGAYSRKRITSEGVGIAFAMRRKGATVSEIAKQLGVARSTAGNLFYQKGKPTRDRVPERETSIQVPPEVLAERDRRISTPYDTWTAFICGDPKPGWRYIDKVGNHARHI